MHSRMWPPVITLLLIPCERKILIDLSLSPKCAVAAPENKANRKVSTYSFLLFVRIVYSILIRTREDRRRGACRPEITQL